MSQKIVVTGGAGFIGSHIVEGLLSGGDYEVTIIDNLSTGNKENIKSFADKISFVEGDILDLELLKKETKGASVIIHQAAIPSVPESVKDPIRTNKVNVEGTLNVFLAAKEEGVKRVVYASSCAVYGDSPELPKKEEMSANPKSPYAYQKVIVEGYAKLFFDLFGLETVGLRYFNVFGPRQSLKSDYAAVVPIFIKKMAGGESPTIYGDGNTTRDFVYVKDVARANIQAAFSEKASGKLLNIGSGQEVSLNNLVDEINSQLGKKIVANYSDFQKGDIQRSVADISLAKDLLGYSPATSFIEGLKQTIESYK